MFAAAGLPKPDISILSDEFLAEVRDLPQKNLAVELLRKLLDDEVKTRVDPERRPGAVVRRDARAGGEPVPGEGDRGCAGHRGADRAGQAAARGRTSAGRSWGSTDDEVAFYDALAANESAVEVLGDETLRGIARELVDTVKRNATIDWTLRENVRANLRVLVKRILRKHGYPPDKQESATRLVLEQAAVLGFEAVREREKTPVAPFRLIEADEVRPFENAIPLYDLAVAAGAFGDGRAVEPEAWVDPNGRVRPATGLFAGRVVGESMNRRIPNGAYCVWRAPVEGARGGRVLIIESRDLSDPETGGSYTVKIYDRVSPDLVRLLPDTDAPGFEPIELRAEAATGVRIVAELVEVLPWPGLEAS